MGVKFDRVLDAFDGPFTKVEGLLDVPPAAVTTMARPAGYLLDHRVNNSFIVMNRLLKAGCPVYWLTKPPAGAVWVPASAAALAILDTAAKHLGVAASAVAKPPAKDALKLKPIRVGLVDEYGGLMTSGWDRWLFERYEFPFELVFPKALETDNLRERFDVLVFPDGAYRKGAHAPSNPPKPERIPEEYRNRLGRVTDENTVPQLRKFVAAGGSVVLVGSSTGLAELLGLPIDNHLNGLGRDKYYIPGSLLKVRINNNSPLAYGMPEEADVFFENSPVFDLLPDAALKNTEAVAWFETAKPLDSGWAWGQQYLKNGVAVLDASVGEGKVTVLGPEVTFRGQPHGTFKLLFNGLYYGSAKVTALP